MLLGYFTEEAYDKLLHDIQHNTENYSSPDEWLSTYFGNNDYFKMSLFLFQIILRGKKTMRKSPRKTLLIRV